MWLAYAALAAVSFGLRGILYHWSSQKPLDRNLMLLGVYLSGALVSVLFALLLRQTWSAAVWTGVVMGTFSFISNAAMYKGFAVGRATLVAVFTALAPVVVAGLSLLLWGETLNAAQTSAFLLIVAGVVLIRYSNELSWGNLQGVQWALLTMVTFGITDVASKQAMLWNAAKLPTLFVMYVTGAILFLALWRFGLRQARTRPPAPVPSRAVVEAAAGASLDRQSPALRNGSMEEPDEDGSGVQPDGRLAASVRRYGEAPAEEPAVRGAIWSKPKTLVWGMIVGLSNISGMMFILPAFQLGITGLVSAVVATNVLLILLYARLVLKERWSVQEMIGIGCALVGVLALRLME